MKNCGLLLLFLLTFESKFSQSKPNPESQKSVDDDSQKSVDDDSHRGFIPVNIDPDRVIGGRYARKGEFPFAVVISFRANSSSCGGVILNKLHVLTACHCTVQYGVGKVVNLLPNDYSNTRVVAGSLSRNPQELHEQGYQIRWVFYSTQHPDCEALRSGAWIFDIAVIIITEPLIFNNLVQPAIIPSNEITMKSMVRMWQTIQKNCVVAGWGFTVVTVTEDIDETFSHPSVYIKALSTRLLPPLHCYYKICRFRCETETITKGNIDRICSKTMRKGAGTICGGDSGGPLICGGFVIGLVSYSSGCSRLDDPVIYARVDVAYKYIAKYYYKPLSFSNLTNEQSTEKLANYDDY